MSSTGVAVQVLFHEREGTRALVDCLVLTEFHPGAGDGYAPGEVITLTLEPPAEEEPELSAIFERWSEDLLVVEVLTAALDGRSYLVLLSDREQVLLEVGSAEPA